MLARKGDECLLTCRGDDRDHFLTAPGTGEVPQSRLLTGHLPLWWLIELQLIHPHRNCQSPRSPRTLSFTCTIEQTWSHCCMHKVLQRVLQQLGLTGGMEMFSSVFSKESMVPALPLPQQCCRGRSSLSFSLCAVV